MVEQVSAVHDEGWAVVYFDGQSAEPFFGKMIAPELAHAVMANRAAAIPSVAYSPTVEPDEVDEDPAIDLDQGEEPPPAGYSPIDQANALLLGKE